MSLREVNCLTSRDPTRAAARAEPPSDFLVQHLQCSGSPGVTATARALPEFVSTASGPRYPDRCMGPGRNRLRGALVQGPQFLTVAPGLRKRGSSSCWLMSVRSTVLACEQLGLKHMLGESARRLDVMSTSGGGGGGRGKKAPHTLRAQEMLEGGWPRDAAAEARPLAKRTCRFRSGGLRSLN